MAVTKNWINYGVGVLAGITLIFGLVSAGLALVINLSFAIERQSGTIDAVGELSILFSAEILFMLGVLVFPVAWVAIAAAMSKRYSVYIILLTMGALTLLGVLGVFIHGTVEYGQKLIFFGNRSTDEMAVALLVLLGCTSLCITILTSCAICGVVSSSSPKRGPFDEPPQYSRQYAASEGGHPFQSYPTVGSQYPTHGSQPAATRTIAYGTPEWEKYYREYIGAQTMRSEVGRDRDFGRSKNVNRNYSYRY